MKVTGYFFNLYQSLALGWISAAVLNDLLDQVYGEGKSRVR